MSSILFSLQSFVSTQFPMIFISLQFQIQPQIKKSEIHQIQNKKAVHVPFIVGHDGLTLNLKYLAL